MNIWGVTSTQGSQGLNALKGVEAAQATDGTQATMQQGVSEVHDSVTLSVDAVRSAESTGDIRFDRVNAIRAAIADGSYDTPEKLDLALDRLLDRLSG
jgi:anti-sigma28 factor (negative regulator of flagellin synthesis)